MTQSKLPSEAPSAPTQEGDAAAKDKAWVLAPDAEPFSRGELLARYRRQRSLPDDPFAADGRPLPAQGHRDRVISHPSPGVRFIEREEATAPEPPRQPALSLGQTFAVAAAMALAAGAGVGMLNATLFPGSDGQQPIANPAAVQASTAAAVDPALEPGQTTVITKKPVATATLKVSDAAGATNSFIPLALQAQPAEAGAEMLLKISGIPEGAYLTSGRKDGNDIWALTPDELKGLKLVIPQAPAPEIDLAVAAFESKTGELAAPVKRLTVALSDVVVQPASAPPPGQATGTESAKIARPHPIPPPDSLSMGAVIAGSTSVPKLLREGDSLLKSGDVREARKVYEQAWTEGSPAGAYGMARSYDPVVIGSLALKNAKADKAKALFWYQRAATAGHVAAAGSIVRLRLKR